MLENSKDLLYIVSSLAILWFTVFLCWLLYQAARVLKNANDIIESVSQKLELIVEAVHFIRDKVEKLSGTMGLMNTMVGGLLEKFVVGKLTQKIDEKISSKKKTKKE